MTYKEWLNGGGCGCCDDTPKPITGECDCNDILLQISMLDTDVDMLSDAFDVLDDKVDDIVVPTNVSDFNNDAGYLTEHQPLKTINGQVISGTGNIVIEGGGTAIDVDSELSLTSTNPVENKVITEALNSKLDASAYTPTDLSNYYTKQEVDAIISGLNATIADLQRQIDELKPHSRKAKITDTSGNTYDVECNSSTTLTLNEILAATHNLNTSNFTKVVIGDCTTEIGNQAFQILNPNHGVGISELYISSSVTTIGNSAFEGNPFTSVTLPDSVTSLGENTFEHCRSMQTINIPTGVTSIPISCFDDCSGLTTVTLHSGITEIGNQAFYDCKSLQSVTIEATTPPTLGDIAFSWSNGIPTYPIYVPANSVDAYKTAWNHKIDTNRIVVYPPTNRSIGG